MKAMHLAVTLLAIGIATPYGTAQNEQDLNGPRDANPVDQGTIDCLRSLGPECFVEAPAVGGPTYVEPYHAPGCEAADVGDHVGGRDLTGDGSDDTPTVHLDRTGGVHCAPPEDRSAPGGGDGVSAQSRCFPWIHVHGSYSGGAWQGATLAHLHHNAYADCHLYGGHWSYSGNCGGAGYYSHDTYRVTFCDAKQHTVCMEFKTYSGEWTRLTCWYQYN